MVDVLPGSSAVDHLGPVDPVEAFGQGIEAPYRRQVALRGRRESDRNTRGATAVVFSHETVETVELLETRGVTKLTMKLAFRDTAGRDHMTKFDGQEDSFDKMEDYLRSLLDPNGTVFDS
jgi:hypothetical protein